MASHMDSRFFPFGYTNMVRYKMGLKKITNPKQNSVTNLKEKVLNWPLYHQNHERRYTCDAEIIDPHLEEIYQTYLKNGREMMAERNPKIINDNTWGLSKYKFDEEHKKSN